MLKTFFATFIIFLITFLEISIGYILKRKKIQKNCVELNNINIKKSCNCQK
ncbi:Hypothetical Protein SOFFGTOCOR_0260 [Candidatus Providencia siddallii]|uniref:Uncharacterized protein n=1 Tax=Candidatus Providencia siddallii TaxID=1715285 RepID=A0A0M6W7D6_9GAMM|nr:Hypothetical Protein SOFFGTOCOR_0260 [Candidatus Providencia siddallii]